jgi:hypothetical protein
MGLMTRCMGTTHVFEGYIGGKNPNGATCYCGETSIINGQVVTNDLPHGLHRVEIDAKRGIGQTVVKVDGVDITGALRSVDIRLGTGQIPEMQLTLIPQQGHFKLEARVRKTIDQLEGSDVAARAMNLLTALADCDYLDIRNVFTAQQYEELKQLVK